MDVAVEELSAFLRSERAPVTARWRRLLEAIGRDEAEIDRELMPIYDELDPLLRARGSESPQVLGQLTIELGRKRAAANVPVRDAVRELGLLDQAVLERLATRRPRPQLETLVMWRALVDEALAGVAHGHARASVAAIPQLEADRLHLAIDQIEDGLVLLDVDGAVVLANHAAEGLLGIKLPRGATELGVVQSPVVRALRTGKGAGPDRVRVHDPHTGEARTLELRVVPLRAGETVGACALVRDVSRRVRDAEALEHADRELQALHERLLRVGHDRSISDLAAGTALALNNELNAMQLAVRLLKSETTAQGRAQRHLDTVEQAAQRSAGLVSRLQELSARRTHAQPRPLDFNAAVMEALDLVRPELTAAATDRAVRIDAHLGELPAVRAPAPELRDVLCKLIVAARDELPHGGVVQLWTRRVEGGAELEVRHPHVAEAADEGARLALDVARDQLARWSGALDERDDGHERTIVLRLPLEPGAAEPAPAPPARAPSEGVRVLVVDDDAGNRETLTELLALSGHVVDAAPSSEAALELVERRPYDAALVDLAMPHMNGLELARRLRADHPDLRIALVTGWEPDAGAAPEAGLIDAVFRKPIDLPAILAFVSGSAAGERHPH